MEGYPRYKFYLDNQLLATEPRGWDNIRYFVKFDRTLNGLLFFIDATLFFSGDGGDILTNALYSEGFCGQHDFKLLEKCSSVYQKQYEGIVKLSKIEINERAPCEVRVKPDDNSYFAKIQNARKQKAFLWAGRSKNDVAIDPVTFHQVAFFNPATGAYYGVQPDYGGACYRVYDGFRYLVEFMTDGDVEFDSTLFGVGGELEWLMITSGLVLFTTQTGLTEAAFKDEFPDISFDELFKEVFKKKNIGFYMDYSGAKPKMFIEKDQDIPNGVDIVTLDNIDEIKTSIATDRLYNIIRLGSQDTLDVVSLAFPEDIDFLGFKEEEYNTIGDCTEDNVLDLVSEWIISSNRIEDAVVTPSDADVGRIFLIEAHDTGAAFILAKQENTLTPPGPPYFYNQGLINSETISNFFGSVPSSIAKYLGPAIDDTFRAEKTVLQQAPGLSAIITFDDEVTPPNYDANGNYNPLLSRYTCPSSGIYSFEVGIAAGYMMSCGDMYLEVRDSTFTTVKIQLPLNVPTWYPNPVPPQPPPAPPAIRSGTLNLTLNDIVVVRWQCSVSGVIAIRPTSYFKCTNTKTGGGVYETFEPKDYLGLVHEFEYPIKRSQFDLIRNEPRGNIIFAQAGQNFRRARIDNIQFDPDGDSKVRLITTIRTNQ